MKVTPRGLAVAGVLGALSVYAVMGGEYSTLDWLRLRQEEAALRTDVQSLQREVDSLKAVVKLVRTDPATQERLAREQYRMIRPGEFLYVFPSDSD